MLDILKYKPVIEETEIDGSKNILDLMSLGRIRVVCVGDGLHSELKKLRWLEAYNDYENENIVGNAMKQEMLEGLSLMELVMRCKCSFPEYFHFLKGNHENIRNTNLHGNHPFRKYVQEGEMVRAFMSCFYGDDVLHLYACMEDSFPLCALCPNCIISHAEPLKAYSKDELIEGLNDNNVILGLTWTNNDESEKGSVKKMLTQLLPKYPKGVYFGGHRPVDGSYSLRQKGKFIQIHNPRQYNVAIVNPYKPFNADNDIVSVKTMVEDK